MYDESCKGKQKEKKKKGKQKESEKLWLFSTFGSIYPKKVNEPHTTTTTTKETWRTTGAL